jgi:hypothetical protein
MPKTSTENPLLEAVCRLLTRVPSRCDEAFVIKWLQLQCGETFKSTVQEANLRYRSISLLRSTLAQSV